MSQKAVHTSAAAAKGTSETVSRLLAHISQFFEQQMNEQDITPSQFDILLTLWNEDGIISSELGKRIEKDGPTTTGMVDRMERKGFIRRKRSTTDRRAVQIFLTPKAVALYEQMNQMQQALLKQTGVESISDRDIDVLDSLLNKIIANIESRVLTKDVIKKHLRKPSHHR